MTDFLVVTAAAFAPALFLTWYFYNRFYRRDLSTPFLVEAFCVGIGAALFSALMLAPTVLLPETEFFRFIVFALAAPIFEEVSKCFLAFRFLLRRFRFVEPSDAIFYSILVALGFASAENVFYLIDAYASGNLQGTAAKRAFLSVPAHALFSTIWGAKLSGALGRKESALRLILPGLALAILYHGLYNALALSPSLLRGLGILLLLGFFLFLWDEGGLRIRAAVDSIKPSRSPDRERNQLLVNASDSELETLPEERFPEETHEGKSDLCAATSVEYLNRFAVALEALQEDDYEKALKLFQILDQESRSDPDVKYNIAVCLVQLGRMEDARKNLTDSFALRADYQADALNDSYLAPIHQWIKEYSSPPGQTHNAASQAEEEFYDTPISVLGWRNLLDLFFHPRRVFQRINSGMVLLPFFFSAWLYGIAYSILALDRKLVRAEINNSLDVLSEEAMVSWAAFWIIVVLLGTVFGYLMWMVGGWWYCVRIGWCGANSPDKRLARLVFIHSSLVISLPSIVLSLFVMWLYENYAEMFYSTGKYALVFTIFPFWSLISGFVGVTTLFEVSRWKARLWFVILPGLFYIITGQGLKAMILLEMPSYSGRVFSDADLPTTHRTWLQENRIVEGNDNIVLFYSRVPPPKSKAGTLLTNDLIVSYVMEDDTPVISTARYNEVDKLALQKRGTLLRPSQIRLQSSTGLSLVMEGPRANGGDKRICDEIIQRATRSRKKGLKRWMQDCNSEAIP